MNRLSSQSGNVFFLILAAVAMFAALAWAFTQNSRQSSGALTSEQSRLAAQELIAYSNQLADVTQKLKLRGCANNQFNFTNTVWTLVNLSPSIPNNPTAASGCAAFSSSEGAMMPVIMPLSYYDDSSPPSATSSIFGGYRIYTVAMPNIGSAAEDIIVTTQRLKLAVCLKINDMLGVNNPGGTPPLYTAATTVNYTGIFPGTNAFTDGPDGAMTGKTAFCGKNASNVYSYWQVLLAR